MSDNIRNRTDATSRDKWKDDADRDRDEQGRSDRDRVDYPPPPRRTAPHVRSVRPQDPRPSAEDPSESYTHSVSQLYSQRPYLQESSPDAARSRRQVIDTTLQETGSYNDYFVHRDGIDREVIQNEITRLLGQDATCRPAEYKGKPGYMIKAYRALTSEMIRSLKEETLRFNSDREKRRRSGRSDITYNAYSSAARPDVDEPQNWDEEIMDVDEDPRYASDYLQNGDIGDPRNLRDRERVREPVEDPRTLRNFRDLRDPRNLRDPPDLRDPRGDFRPTDLRDPRGDFRPTDLIGPRDFRDERHLRDFRDSRDSRMDPRDQKNSRNLILTRDLRDNRLPLDTRTISDSRN